MNTSTIKTLTGIGVVLGFAAVLFFSLFNTVFASNASKASTACRITTASTIAIGNQATTQLLAANSIRSYARIELAQTSAGVATTTGFIEFSTGSASANSIGVLSTSTPTREFGLNTDFNYTGQVSAAATASTTVRVTECIFTP